MIRRADADDITGIVDLGREFHAMAQIKIPYDPYGTRCFLEEALKNDAVAVFVVEQDGKLAGTAGAILAPVFFNLQVRVAQEMFWFVSKDARGRRDSLRLLEAMEAWARENQAVSLTMVSLAVNPNVGYLYLRRGYTALETHYVKEL